MAAEDATLLRANCAALASVDPSLAAAISAAVPAGGMDREPSRGGPAVPVALRGGSRVHLHSPYDPRREAARLAGRIGEAGCVVVIGLGGGFHVEAVRSLPGAGTILVVEKDHATLRTLFSLLDLRPILSDPRVMLAAGAARVSSLLAAAWQPALQGRLETLVLPALRTVDPDFCRQAEDAVRDGVEQVRVDYSVQAHFGKRWFLNMARNLPRVRHAAPLPAGVSEATITAAGPSLEPALARLSRARGMFILATDTSLPALVRSGIAPAVVLSIDCQVYSYHHFLQGIPPETTVVLDLASPPVLARQGRPSFVAGSHPFAQWLARTWGPLPWVDTSGGNVTHSAASLALLLGARRITLAGADFGYPAGKPYSRGTYVYDVFGLAAGRRSPTEGQVYDFVHRGKDLEMEVRDGVRRYTTPLLRAYGERLSSLSEASGAEITVYPGEGLPLRAATGRRREPAAGQRPVPPAAPATAGHGSDDCPWQEILDRYATAVERLPGLAPPAWSSFSSLRSEQRQVWQTLFPVAAAVARENTSERSPPEVLAQARDWVVRSARQVIAAGDAAH